MFFSRRHPGSATRGRIPKRERRSLQNHPVTIRVKRKRFLRGDATEAEYQVRLEPGENQLEALGGVTEMSIEIGPTFNLPLDELQQALSMSEVKQALNGLEGDSIPELPQIAGFGERTCQVDNDCGSQWNECLPSGRCGSAGFDVWRRADGYTEGYDPNYRAEYEAAKARYRAELDRRKWVEKQMQANESIAQQMAAKKALQERVKAMEEWIQEQEKQRAADMFPDYRDHLPEYAYTSDPAQERRLASNLVASWKDEDRYNRIVMSMSLPSMKAVQRLVQNMQGDSTARQVADNLARWSRIRDEAQFQEDYRRRKSAAWERNRREEAEVYKRYPMGRYGVFDTQTGRYVR